MSLCLFCCAFIAVSLSYYHVRFGKLDDSFFICVNLNALAANTVDLMECGAICLTPCGIKAFLLIPPSEIPRPPTSYAPSTFQNRTAFELCSFWIEVSKANVPYSTSLGHRSLHQGPSFCRRSVWTEFAVIGLASTDAILALQTSSPASTGTLAVILLAAVRLRAEWENPLGRQSNPNTSECEISQKATVVPHCRHDDTWDSLHRRNFETRVSPPSSPSPSLPSALASLRLPRPPPSPLSSTAGEPPSKKGPNADISYPDYDVVLFLSGENFCNGTEDIVAIDRLDLNISYEAAIEYLSQP
ncbi:hypothetical protein BKA93DRAFT_877568 [Sparassis latifolia]